MHTDYPFSYTVVTYNVGQKFDYKQLLLRNGSKSTDLVIQKLYQSIKPDYDNAIVSYNQDQTANKPFWKHPKFQVTPNDLAVFGAARNEGLKKVYEKMRQKCDIVLLQEVTNNEEFDLVKQSFSEGFSWSYETKNNYQNEIILDAVVGWKRNVFKCLNEIKDTSPNIKMTSVILQDLVRGVIFQVTSLHAPGYSIKKPTEKEIQAGDLTVLSAVDASKKINGYKPDFFVVGGDYNSEIAPLHYTTTSEFDFSQKRFKILKNNDFYHVPQDAPTAYNVDLSKTVDLDHLFVKNGQTKGVVGVLTDNEFTYPLEDPSKNSSDHRPLFFSIKLEPT